MNLIEALRSRRSIRRYRDELVSKDQTMALIEAAETAPSAGNLRAREYIVVINPQMKTALAMAAFGQKQVETAPLLIVICADIGRSSSRYGDRGSLYGIQDATAAIMCLLLAAYDLGLGACWNGAFDDALVREALDLKEGVLPVAIISLGYPAESPLPASLRRAEEMVRWIE
jgi:nitroreductase